MNLDGEVHHRGVVAQQYDGHQGDHARIARGRPWCRAVVILGRVGVVRSDEPEAAYLVQQPVQGSLTGYQAADDRLAAIAADLQTLEPGSQRWSRDPSTRIS